MRSKTLFGALAAVALAVTYMPPARAAGVQVTFAQWSGRKFTVCANDLDRPPGARIQLDFFVDAYYYDRLHLTNSFPASCAEREFAPFGPRRHTIAPVIADEPGDAAVPLPSRTLEEGCDVFAGTNAQTWCTSTTTPAVSGYYDIRQMITVPLASDSLLVGVNVGYGGLIQQLYSEDRSYNLVDEHPGGGLGPGMWGLAPPGSFGNLEPCNWAPPPPLGSGPPMELVHFIFSQGTNCDYRIWADGEGLTWDRGMATGLLSYLLNPEHHGRRLTLTGMNIGQMIFNRGEYLDITYGYRNRSRWDFGEHGQEIPAIQLNRGVNREYAWSRDEPPGYGYRAVAEGETFSLDLAVPGVSPFAGQPGTDTWNGRWVTVCGEGRKHCVTAAPADPPSRTGILGVNVRANTDRIDTVSGRTVSNQISLVGRFAIPRSEAIKTIRVYIFPRAIIQPLPTGGTVLQQIQSLQRW